MPVGSMIEKFRPEFDEALEKGVPGAHTGTTSGGPEIKPPGGDQPMPARAGAVA
jgi:hypothetical protein